jgi:cation-transporting ATPase 13A1
MVLSKLFTYGVKQGDRQLTVLGIVVASLFYFVTRAEPLPTLSPTRPPSSVLCMEAFLSILVQFLIHSGTILFATDTTMQFVDPYDPSLVPDGAFVPNAMNSCTFLLTCLATINTFAVNYRGRPYMANLNENKLMYRSLQVCYASLLIMCLEVFPPLNDLLQLSPMPVVMNIEQDSGSLRQLMSLVGLPVFLCGLMTIDTALVFSLERFFVNKFNG